MNKRINVKWLSRTSVILFLDILIILCAYLAALRLRFDLQYSEVPRQYLLGWFWSMPYWIASTVVVYYGCRLYHSIWSFASMHELERIVAAYIVLLPVYLAGIWFMDLHMPKSYYFVGYVLTFCLCTGMRFSYRLLRYWKHTRERSAQQNPDAQDRIMVIGAGEAGQVIIKELTHSDKLNTQVCCVIDDNPGKKGRFLEGVEIVGNRHGH